MRQFVAAFTLCAVPLVASAQLSSPVTDAELQAILDNASLQTQPTSAADQKVGYTLPLKDIAIYEGDASIAKTHLIVDGDTLYKLSKTYGVSISSIQHVNGLSDFKVSLGDTLKIPAANTTTEPPRPIQPAPARADVQASHIVQPGDTLYGIARAYCIKSDSLNAANPGLRADRLQIGTQVRLPDGYCTPKTPTKP